MAWNEPTGGSNKPKDPWGGNNSNQGPPDLDEVLKNLQAKLQGLFRRWQWGWGWLIQWGE